MGVKGVVRAGLVSKKWYAASRHPASWRWHCLRLAVNGLVRVRAPARPEGWYPSIVPSTTESNFTHALPQGIVRFLNGHTDLCTT
ncbi:hypothetical protein M405DRAFT_796182 [Rhizopogon salebrosus TDB-379]|nr:hypothetical protein M405DRAFT_796182 [Rhizopogon salebrosus TDB-379]